ncbi:MAG TPA: FAD-binding protein [Polyangiaceae bacterium]|nr:FAD-binding protein [Polyangiaceae bacterium]
MPNPVIDVRVDQTWNNWHSSSGVGGTVARFFIPWNDWDDNSAAPAGKPFVPGLAGLKSIVRQAEAAGKRVRALGSGWSLNNVAFVPDYLIDTANLSALLIGFGPRFVSPSQQADSERFVFSQCGAQLKTINQELAKNGLALPTSGASNGQTIVGAMSTGTHGSANSVGAIQDFILGLHIVGEGGEDYWIERASQPAMSDAFVDWLGAQLIRDDDLFLSAVVGFGSFGVIHGVVFKAEPLYVLELFVQQLDYQRVLQAATTLDMRGLGLPDGDALPFHFEVVFNPYKRGAGQGGAFVRVLNKRPFVAPGPSVLPTDGASLHGRDLVSIAGVFSGMLPGPALGDFLQGQLLSSVTPTAPRSVPALPGVAFGDSQPTGGGTSVELGIPINRIADALNAIWAVTDVHPFGAPVALRYVKSSDALLAFSHFPPITCTIEMPGVDSAAARIAHQAIFAAFKAASIPHSFHWGQQAPEDPQTVVASFGRARVDRWLAARRMFLKSAAARHMFSNDLLTACGLST